MRYQLCFHGWNIGDKLVPVGTIIDSNGTDDWSRLAQGRVPPPNSVALDNEAYQVMRQHYPAHLIPRPAFAGVQRT